MTVAPQGFSSAVSAFTGSESGVRQVSASPECPACANAATGSAVERLGNYELFHCAACDLQYWEPRVMPDARWYEQMYGGRDEKLLPLEPGHKYFLSDPLSPGHGELLDIGCGTGNFLAAAKAAGFTVTGTELDRNAAQFAKTQLGLPKVLGLTISEFAEKYPAEKFDIATFFEVLEHQAKPVEFLQGIKACLRPRGYIALSVPNRERWLTGPDVLDYPPNHFLRWNVTSLRNLLIKHGFEILSVREQPVGIVHTAQMINMSLRTGISANAAGNGLSSFRDVMQMAPDEASTALQAAPSPRQRAMQILGRIKYTACLPIAVAAYPYVRMRGYKGTYLYLLARLIQ